MLVCTSIYVFILVRTDSYQSYASTYQYRPMHTSSYQHISICKYIPVQTCTYQLILAHPNTYLYGLACTSIYQKFLDSKKLQTRFEPVIFCILFVYFTTALRVHSEQILGICQWNCLCIYPFCRRRPPRSDPASCHDVHSTDLDWNLTMAQPSTVTVTGFGMCNVPADGRATQEQPDTGRPRLERWPI